MKNRIQDVRFARTRSAYRLNVSYLLGVCVCVWILGGVERAAECDAKEGRRNSNECDRPAKKRADTLS